MSDAAPQQSPVPNTAKDAVPGKKPRRAFARAGVWLLAVLVVALGVVGTSAYWLPAIQPLLTSHPQSNPQNNEPIATVAARLAAIERRLDTIQSLDDRLAAIERRPAPDASASLAPLEDQLQQLSARLDATEARLAQLIKDQTTRGDSAQRILIVALADLGNAVSTSRPFAAPLASVEALGQSRPGWAMALRPLEAPAKNGIPSAAVLAQRFSDEVATAILRADAASPSTQSSLGQAVLAKLRSLVVIRRTDGAGDNASPVDSAVAMSEAALAKEDLAGAVAALGNLSGAPATAAAAWLQQAQQRLQAEQTIAKLTQELSSDLAAAGGG
jgi:hypothetical protein